MTNYTKFVLTKIRLLSVLSLFFLGTFAHAQPAPEVMERLTQLVAQGQLESAKSLADSLLLVYPEDAQLLAIQKTLQTRIANAKSVTVPALTADEQMEINTFTLAVRNALAERNTAARQEQLDRALKRNVPARANSGGSEWLDYWQLRLVASLMNDDITHGWPATQALRRLNAASGANAQLQEALASANLKGWWSMSAEEYQTARTRHALIEERKRHWVGSHSVQLNSNDRQFYTQTLVITNPLSPELSRYSSFAIISSRELRMETESRTTVPGEWEYKVYRNNVLNERTVKRITRVNQKFNSDFSQLSIEYDLEGAAVRHIFILVESPRGRTIHSNQGSLNFVFTKL
jgi:hypothetical protein